MTVTVLASITALEARLGQTLTDEDLARAEAALEDASALVQAESGRTWVDESTGDPDPRVAPIVLAVAKRAFLNPEGATMIVAGSFTAQYPGGVEAAGIYLTPAERRTLRMLAGASAILSVEVTRPENNATDDGTVYVAVSSGGDLFPLLTDEWA